ncbi:MAG: RsmD family RNA methyltransferase [Bacteroidales bacterium]|nr:RsmD family RNA methyltransferase [Bacteroidales bacterium]
MDSLNIDTQQFIKEHRNDDVAELALHRPKNPLIDFETALTQIAGYNKAKHKMPWLAANEAIRYPKVLSLEQCSSEATANFKAGIFGGGTLLDLTGGFGVDSIAFSRQFERVIYVEKNSELCELMSFNCSCLGINNIEVINDEAENFLARTSSVDVIYLDPSRRTDKNEKVFRLEQCSPNVLELLPLLIQKAKIGILCKYSPIADIKNTIELLPEVTAFWVVSVKNECKELLCAVDMRRPRTTEPEITAVDINNRKQTALSFTFQEESETKPLYTEKVMKYLYEPSNSVLKAGAFKLLSARFNLRKLHQHTHLYTSDSLREDFQGNIYKVVTVLSFNKKDLKNALSDLKNICLKVRNFPMSVENLSKRLGIKVRGEGNRCLFATTLSDGTHSLILAERISGCSYWRDNNEF